MIVRLRNPVKLCTMINLLMGALTMTKSKFSGIIRGKFPILVGISNMYHALLSLWMLLILFIVPLYMPDRRERRDSNYGMNSS